MIIVRFGQAIEATEYFALNYHGRCDDTYKSLAEKKIDESETDGGLARILEVLQQIHTLFFHPKLEVDVAYVRLILKLIRQKVRAGCALYFIQVMLSSPPEESRIWGMAEELGAMCCVDLGPKVTRGDSGHGIRGCSVGSAKREVLGSSKVGSSCLSFISKEPRR